MKKFTFILFSLLIFNLVSSQSISCYRSYMYKNMKLLSIEYKMYTNPKFTVEESLICIKGANVDFNIFNVIHESYKVVKKTEIENNVIYILRNIDNNKKAIMYVSNERIELQRDFLIIDKTIPTNIIYLILKK